MQTDAKTRLLAITELLEVILLHVDQQSPLTSCLRISKTLNEMISSSKLLQQHLFSLPLYPKTSGILQDKAAW